MTVKVSVILLRHGVMGTYHMGEREKGRGGGRKKRREGGRKKGRETNDEKCYEPKMMINPILCISVPLIIFFSLNSDISLIQIDLPPE